MVYLLSISKGQSRMDNPEILAALGKHDEDTQSKIHNTVS